jgi:hypothetical protein
MSTKHNIPEMNEQGGGILTPTVGAGVVAQQKPEFNSTHGATSPTSNEMLPSPQELDNQGLPSNVVHELDLSSRITSFSSNEMFPSSHELGDSAAQPQPLAVQPTSPSTIRRKDVPKTAESIARLSQTEIVGLKEAASNEKEEQELQILKDRIERIRAEKERLTRIQELEALEEETKRAILDKQMRAAGGSGSGRGN